MAFVQALLSSRTLSSTEKYLKILYYNQIGIKGNILINITYENIFSNLKVYFLF